MTTTTFPRVSPIEALRLVGSASFLTLVAIALWVLV